MAKKTKDHSSQMELFCFFSHSDGRPSETPTASVASRNEDVTTTEDPEAVTNPGALEIPSTDPTKTVIPTSRNAADGSITTEPINMTRDRASATVVTDTIGGPHARNSAPIHVICESQPEAPTAVAAHSANDARSLDVPSEDSGPAKMGGDLNPECVKDLPEEQSGNGFRSAISGMCLQGRVTAAPVPISLPPSTLGTIGQATCSATHEMSNVEKAQQCTRLKCKKKPGRKSLLPIRTGAEVMQARALALYEALTRAAGMSELEIHSPGSPVVPLNSDVLDAVRTDYLTHDDNHQRVLSTYAGNPALIAKNEYLAGDRARKRIERGLDDLVEMGAVETDDDSNPVNLRRLPEIKRILAGWGAVNVRCCPGGKRQLCDAAGNEIHHALNRKATPADKPLEQDHEVPDRRHG